MGEREKEEAVRVKETPCVGTSGWHSGGCLQSVILTSFLTSKLAC